MPLVEEAELSPRPPVAAVGPDGRTTVVWQAHRDDGGESVLGVEARQIESDGTLGEILTLSEGGEPADRGIQPALDVAPDGVVTVVWITESLNFSGRQIVARQIAADGEPRGDIIEIEGRDASTGSPSVAVDASGRATVVWSRSFAGTDLVARQLEPNGSVTERLTLTEESEGGRFASDIDVTPDGLVTVAWSSAAGGGGPARVRQIEPDGELGALHTPDPEHVGRNVQVGMDSAGRATVIWVERDETEFEVKGIGLDEEGEPTPIRSLVSDQRTFAEAGGVSLAVPPEGEAALVWHRTEPGENDELLPSEVRLRSVDMFDGELGPIRTVAEADFSNETFFTVAAPSVEADAEGRLTVAWNRLRIALAESPPEIDARVEARQLAPDGETLGPTETVSDVIGDGFGVLPVLAVDPASGLAALAWRSADGEDEPASIEASRLTEPFEPPPPPPPPPPEAQELPASLTLDRALIRRGVLAVRGSLDPRAAGERVALRLRTRSGQIRMNARVRANGRYGTNQRLRGPLRSERLGVLDLRYRGNETLRSTRARVRAAQAPVRLRIADPQTRGNAFRVRGRVHPRVRAPVAIALRFNRQDGSPAQEGTRVRTDRRGRFQLKGRSQAVRDPNARVVVIHRGQGRAHGQVVGAGL